MLDHELDKTVGYSARIVSAYISRNSIAVGELAVLLITTHACLQTLTQTQAQAHATKPAPEPQKPVVSIKKSVTEDYLVCLEDGRRFKSLKRHLRVRYNMTPEQYRIRWQLPPDYPMVAPGYAQKRSDMAKSMGLGQPRGARKPA
jgi:predicted transcriptional regulator